MSLPTLEPIETERLLLRAVTAADLPDLQAVNGDDEVTRFLPYASWQGPEDAASWLARMLALGQTGTGQQLVLVQRSDARVIGSALLFRHEQGSRRIELGYVLGRAHWRQGYMREALVALCGHVFGPLGLRRIEAEVQPDNQPSEQLLRSLGFTLEGRLRERWEAKGRIYDTHLFACLASDWQRGAQADEGRGRACHSATPISSTPKACPGPSTRP